MAFKKKPNFANATTVTLGGKDATGKAYPTELEGYYLGNKSVDGDFGAQLLHFFQTDKGTVGVWGKTSLNSQLTESDVGVKTLVEFQGMKQPTKRGRKPSYDYQVSTDAQDLIEVDGYSSTLETHDEDGLQFKTLAEIEDDAETDADGEETQADEVTPVRATPPARKAAPTAAAQAKAKALLGKGRNATA